MSISSDTVIDYDGPRQANLCRVFGERDAARPVAAIHEIHAEAPLLNVAKATAKGHIAFRAAATSMHASLPSNAACTAIRPAIGHDGIARSRRRSGPQAGLALPAGTDIAMFDGGRIHSLHRPLDSLAT